MDVKQAITAIKTISTTTGSVYCPSVVSEAPAVSPRAVQVIDDEPGLVIEIAADGRCLASLKKQITEVVGPCVFADEVKPPVTNQPSEDDAN